MGGALGEINYAFLDPWSLVHGLVGVVMAALKFGLLPTMALAFTWEFAERVLKDLLPGIFPHPSQDSLANAVGDILSTAACWYLTARLIVARRRLRHTT